VSYPLHEEGVVASDFFAERLEQSRIKAQIVTDYFWAWAKVMVGTQKRYPDRDQQIAYVDLFAGPGRYDDGTLSTPVLILEQAIADPDVRGRLLAIFNDKDANNSRSLEQCIRAIPEVGSLTHRPVVYTGEVTVDVVRAFEARRLVPTFLFVDPFG
jgi:three-Cys-motif partner protein